MSDTARPSYTIINLISELKSITDEIDKIQKEAGKLEKLKERQNDVAKSIIRKLDEIDVIQRGNMEWEPRTLSFLLSLYSELKGRE